MSDLNKLEQLCGEADILLSKHEDVYAMHEQRACLDMLTESVGQAVKQGSSERAKRGMDIAERIITLMRTYDQTKKW